jgi:uncharacterized membrane protein YfcA
MIAGWDPLVVLASLAAVMAGALVKGVTGIGLPMVAVPLMVQVMPVPMAIALLSVPVLSSNLFQLNDRREVAQAVRRFWALLLVMVVAVVAGALVLIWSEPHLLEILMGVLVLALAIFSIAKPEIGISPEKEAIASPLVGLLGGLLGGISSFYGPPLVLYLIALKLPKDRFVLTISLFYLIGQIPLYVMLAGSDLFGGPEFLASLFLSVPAYFGVKLGQRVRDRIDPLLFTRIVLLIQIGSGASLLWKGLG